MTAKAKLFFACNAPSFWKTAWNWPLTSPITTLYVSAHMRRVTSDETYILEAILGGEGSRCLRGVDFQIWWTSEALALAS
jgi:hypothetical protein